MTRLKLLLPVAAVIALVAYLLPGCDELITDSTTIIEAGHPIAEFAVAPDSGCEPLTITLDDQSAGPRDRAIWYFYRGSSNDPFDSITFEIDPADSTIINADTSYTFDSTGVYAVRLTIYDTPRDPGRDSEYKKRAVIVGTSILDFGASDTVICTGTPVTFDPSVYDWGAVNSWSWSFGDGTPASTDSAPTHTYNTPGVYDVTVTAIGPCGQKIITDTNLIRVFSCPDLLFDADTTEGCVPLRVTFTNRTVIDSTDSLVRDSLKWSLGAGAPGAQDSVAVTYRTPGIYDASLTYYLTGTVGGEIFKLSLTDTLKDYITVYDTASARFTTVTPAEGCYYPWSQFQVMFHPEHAGDYDSLVWYFGDTAVTGEPIRYVDSGDGEAPTNPIHAYTSPGAYIVYLEAYGTCDDTAKKVSDSLELITLYAAIKPDSVDFRTEFNDGSTTIVTDSGDTSGTFEFTDLTNGMVEERVWDFGIAGETAIGEAASYKYTIPGTYLVTLTVSNPCGSVTDTIEVFVDTVATPPDTTGGGG